MPLMMLNVEPTALAGFERRVRGASKDQVRTPHMLSLRLCCPPCSRRRPKRTLALCPRLSPTAHYCLSPAARLMSPPKSTPRPPAPMNASMPLVPHSEVVYLTPSHSVCRHHPLPLARAVSASVSLALASNLGSPWVVMCGPDLKPLGRLSRTVIGRAEPGPLRPQWPACKGSRLGLTSSQAT